ncbi:hypothetical protein [Pararhizobium sp. O133]
MDVSKIDIGKAAGRRGSRANGPVLVAPGRLQRHPNETPNDG